MKMEAYSTLQGMADFLIADLERTIRHVQAFREWAWLRASQENLKEINNRVVRKDWLYQ